MTGDWQTSREMVHAEWQAAITGSMISRYIARVEVVHSDTHTNLTVYSPSGGGSLGREAELTLTTAEALRLANAIIGKLDLTEYRTPLSASFTLPSTPESARAGPTRRSLSCPRYPGLIGY